MADFYEQGIGNLIARCNTGFRFGDDNIRKYWNRMTVVSEMFLSDLKINNPKYMLVKTYFMTNSGDNYILCVR